MSNQINEQPTLNPCLLDAFSLEIQQKLSDIFSQQTPIIMKEIKQHLKKDELNDLKTKAHLLKGSCLALGASKMAGICELLQNKETDKSDFNDLILLLEKDFKLLQQKLKEFLQ